MNLNCPKCGSEDTQKLTLAMDKGGVLEKGAKFGAFYVYNIWIPLITVLAAIMFGVVFAMWNGYLGLIAFAAILYAGWTARKWVKEKTKSKFADVPVQMKQNGFQCNRCENMFLPAT
jgi:hypothetical protein